ncbi:MAG: glycosyltransferase family 1 protein [Acidobacteria bacterium]|nr:glycosyltransferase family 1 protein [Acidobacteriota bacterium]
MLHVLDFDRGDIDSGATQAMGADQDQKSGVGRAARGEVTKPRLNDIATRQRVERDHGGILAGFPPGGSHRRALSAPASCIMFQVTWGLRRMKAVAVFSMVADGHMRRLLPLVSGLSSRGVAAHVFTHRRFERAVAAAGGTFVDLFGKYPLEAADAGSFPIAMRSVSYAGHYIEQVQRDVEALGASLILSDTFAMIGRVAAARIGVPHVNVCAGHNVDPGEFQRILATDARVVVSTQCLRAVELLRDRYGVRDASPFSYVAGLSPILNVYGEPPEYLTAGERAVFEPVAFFGSLPSTDEIVARNRDQGPCYFGRDATLRVYVSFGTVVWRSYATEALAALESISAAIARYPRAEATISLGGAELGAAEMRALTRPNVAVESFVDQWAILRQADLFITHHGLNSTHEAICHGVPMVSYPFFWDQPSLAAKCRGFGVATPLTESPRGAVLEAHVHAAIAAVHDGRDSMRARLAAAREYELKVIAGRDAVLNRILALC